MLMQRLDVHFTDMEWMCALDEKKDLDVGMSYRAKKCCEFIQCFAEEQQASLQGSLQSGNFFSVMVDGTTDSSVTEAEIISFRYTSTFQSCIARLALILTVGRLLKEWWLSTSLPM